MSLTYTTYTAQLANLMVVPTTDTNFQTFLPGCIDYAEQRIYRELQLMDTEVRDTGTLNANTRNFTLPATYGNFVVVHGMNVFRSAGVRSQLTPVSRNVLDFTYPNEASPGAPSIPVLFAMITDTTAIVGPAADQQYTMEVIGTIRPTALSSGNPTTILTDDLPDLFMAASMVFATGYQRDFGSQSDDPKMSASWEQQYQTLKESANMEEMKKKYNLYFASGRTNSGLPGT